ncbi:hypothetical protein [Thiomicrorhabdus xiamenensis]|uniref:Uncharacterized protein n=1 Tax=Thiomicrorhabdus xiamenensis TaxID=2739063 RepID=A0A7D4SZP0_9GAMM|nr:hypothetical protein [Thiomicrorhabdus xiamenensis]QKI90124.1 hypothetical protein HQN79_11340 [Thiomicrorhabdus xiamenensis]
MMPGSSHFKNIVKDTNISSDEALRRFDINLENLCSCGLPAEEMESKVRELSKLSAWLQEAIEKGETMENLQSRASQLAKLAFDLGCCREEVEQLLTIYPKY